MGNHVLLKNIQMLQFANKIMENINIVCINMCIKMDSYCLVLMIFKVQILLMHTFRFIQI